MCSNFQKAEGVFVNRSVSCLWSPLAPDLRSCPCVAAALFGSPTFLRGHGAVSRSRRLMQFSRFGYEELQAGRPAANSLVRIKKAAPQGEPPHIVRTVQKRGLQGVEQANQRLAWRSESGARPVFVWRRSWL